MIDGKIKLLCEKIFGKKRFEIFLFLCERADENNFILVKIEDIMKELNFSKPTIINAFKFLEENNILKKHKNGFYELLLGGKNDT